MPELNGLDATRRIREWEDKTDSADTGTPQPASDKRHIPIIVMTAQAMKGDHEKRIASGMDDYVPKPIKREMVFDMLQNWVLEKI